MGLPRRSYNIMDRSQILSFFSSEQLLLPTVATFILTTFLLYLKSKRLERQLTLSHRRLSENLHALGSATSGMGKKMKEMEKALSLTAQKQGELEAKDVSGFAYTQANKMLQLGAEKDQLVSNCGLSQAEANLVALMHRTSKRQTATTA